MKKSSFLALAIAPMILGAPLAAQADSVSTDPVGFVKLNLEPGLQTVGAAMVKPAVGAGRVASSNADSITLEGEIASLDADTAYYVEVTGGDGGIWIGDRFDLNVSATSGSTLAIDVDSSRNTVDLSATDLTGYTVNVRPHVLLADLLPPGELQPGDAATGDQVLFWDIASSSYEIHTLEEGVEFLGIPDAWRSDGELTDGRVIAPGEGFFVRRRGASVELLTNIGEVRTNDFRQPIAVGLNLIAEGHPLDSSPASRLMTSELGFQAGDAATGDQILVFNPTTGSYDIYTYEEGVDFLGIPDAWRSDGEVYDTATLMTADGAVFFRKRGDSEAGYTAPKTF